MVTVTTETPPSTPSHLDDTTPIPPIDGTEPDGEKPRAVAVREERWIELEAADDREEEEEDRQPEIMDLFADPDPYDTFPFTFRVSRDSHDDGEDDRVRRRGKTSHDDDGEQQRQREEEEEITITLHGIKAENGQLLNSTGLTLWRASSLLCDLLLATPHLVRNRRVVELGAGLGLCGILAQRLGAERVVMTDGDSDTLENMRKNVAVNVGIGGGGGGVEEEGEERLSCAQLRWGRDVPTFKTRYAAAVHHNDGSPSPSTGFDVVMGSDIIYTEDIIEPLFDTVMELMSPDPGAVFLLAYARRNVKIDLVFECGERHGLSWAAPEGVKEGVYVFKRS